MYPKPLCIKSKMARSWHAWACPPRNRKTGPWPRTRPWEPFIPGGSPYVGQAILGEPVCYRSVLPRTESIVTKPASAAATLAAPCPSLFSDSGSLAEDLVEAYLTVRNETECR